MATLKSKRKQEAKVESLENEVKKYNKTASVDEEVTYTVETTPETLVNETTSPYMNEVEQIALAEQHEKVISESKKVSIEKMQMAVEVVQEQFNLCDKNFSVNGFADKGSKCQLSMSNDDFDIVIVIKDTEKFGIL